MLGVLIAVRTREAPVAQIAGGNLTPVAFRLLQTQRNDANRFMIEVMDRVQLNNFNGFSLLPDPERDLIFSELLTREADRLKIAVPDDTVTEYIKNATNKKMTKDIYLDVRDSIKLTDKEIMECLRRELRARRAFELLYPMQMVYGNGGITSPAMRYEYFKKLNVRQSAELIAIPVSDFET